MGNYRLGMLLEIILFHLSLLVAQCGVRTALQRKIRRNKTSERISLSCRQSSDINKFSISRELHFNCIFTDGIFRKAT